MGKLLISDADYTFGKNVMQAQCFFQGATGQPSQSRVQSADVTAFSTSKPLDFRTLYSELALFIPFVIPFSQNYDTVVGYSIFPKL